MVIAIDIDNTILKCKSKLYKIISELEKLPFIKVPGKEIKIENQNDRKFSKRNRKILGKLGNIDEYEEIEGSINALNELSRQGHKIVFLSSRPNIRFFNEIILEWFQNNKVDYDFLLINCKDKAKFCKEHGVGLLIDDSLSNCERATKMGINTIWLNSNEKEKMPQKFTNNKKIHLAKNWKEIISMVKNKSVDENQMETTREMG